MEKVEIYCKHPTHIWKLTLPKYNSVTEAQHMKDSNINTVKVMKTIKRKGK